MATRNTGAELPAAGINLPIVARMSAASLKIKKQPLPSQALSDDQSSPDWSPKRLDPRSFPDQPSGYGGPPPTIVNVKYLLDQNRIESRYNVIKKKTEVAIPGLPGIIDNGDSVCIAQVKSLMALHGIQNGDARSIVDAIANQTPTILWETGYDRSHGTASTACRTSTKPSTRCRTTRRR